MATAYHNLSEYDFNSVPNAENMKFGIVVSEWNFNITGALLNGAVNTLKTWSERRKYSGENCTGKFRTNFRRQSNDGKLRCGCNYCNRLRN